VESYSYEGDIRIVEGDKALSSGRRRVVKLDAQRENDVTYTPADTPISEVERDPSKIPPLKLAQQKDAQPSKEQKLKDLLEGSKLQDKRLAENVTSNKLRIELEAEQPNKDQKHYKLIMEA